MVNIRTNNHWRDIIHYSELPPEWQKEFAHAHNGDYTESPEYFLYKGEYFDLSGFTRIVTLTESPNGFGHVVAKDSPLAKWQGIMHGTFDSGWLIRLSRDDSHYGQVQVAQFW